MQTYSEKITIIQKKIRGKCNIMSSYEEIDQLLIGLRGVDKPTIVSFINAHAYNLIHQDKLFLTHLLASDCVFRDGMGMQILFKLLKHPPGINMNGTDFIPKMIASLPNSVALYGTSDERLLLAREKLMKQDVNIVESLNGFLDDQTYVEHAILNKPYLIILAMGMPKQERVAVLLKERLTYPCVIVNGGAIVDYISNAVPRAPKWVRQIGCEWLFRLLCEPKRLWTRYVIGNVVFLVRAFCIFAWNKRPIVFEDRDF